MIVSSTRDVNLGDVKIPTVVFSLTFQPAMPVKTKPRGKKGIVHVSSQCSPARYCHHKNTGTCLLSDEMTPILKALGVATPVGASHAQLIGLMRLTAKKMGLPSSSDQTLAELAGQTSQDSTLKKTIREAYRPIAPDAWKIAKGSKWLSSEDINTVMRQYETARPDFMFIGVSPIDFADRPAIYGGRCVSPAMCALDIPGLIKAKQKTHLGVVLNMDKHNASGSHWVSIYIGLDPASINYGVFYYDSVANPPDRRVAVWMKGIQRTVMDLGGKPIKPIKRKGAGVFQVAHNIVRRQFGQSECGIFSMMFLIHCMFQVSAFKEICEILGGDDVMKVMRTVLFRPSPVIQRRVGLRPRAA